MDVLSTHTFRHPLLDNAGANPRSLSRLISGGKLVIRPISQTGTISSWEADFLCTRYFMRLFTAFEQRNRPNNPRDIFPPPRFAVLVGTGGVKLLRRVSTERSGLPNDSTISASHLPQSLSSIRID